MNINKIGKVKLNGYRCRCGHEWLSRNNLVPKVCPKCKSPNYDKLYDLRYKK